MFHEYINTLYIYMYFLFVMGMVKLELEMNSFFLKYLSVIYISNT